jgi:hypothetical protein
MESGTSMDAGEIEPLAFMCLGLLSDRKIMANALKSNWNFQLRSKQVQVTTDSQQLALPLNASLLVELPSS